MKVSVIKIGNSRGIRLSKTILEKYEIKDSVEMILEENTILLKPIVSPRNGWDEKFRKMHTEHDDKLFIDDVFQDENLDEWK